MPGEVFKDKAGEWRWRLKGANGEIVAQSESYPSAQHAERGLETAEAIARADAQDTAESNGTPDA